MRQAGTDSEGIASLPAASRSPQLSSSNSGSGSPPPPDSAKDSIRFSTGIPEASISYGSIRLFRDASAAFSSSDAEHTSQLVCVVAVPLSMAPSELCTFMGPHIDNVEAMHVLRDARASTGSYMTLIKFRNETAAQEFYNTYNGRLYTSFDSHVRALFALLEWGRATVSVGVLVRVYRYVTWYTWWT